MNAPILAKISTWSDCVSFSPMAWLLRGWERRECGVREEEERKMRRRGGDKAVAPSVFYLRSCGRKGTNVGSIQNSLSI